MNGVKYDNHVNGLISEYPLKVKLSNEKKGRIMINKLQSKYKIVKDKTTPFSCIARCISEIELKKIIKSPKPHNVKQIALEVLENEPPAMWSVKPTKIQSKEVNLKL